MKTIRNIFIVLFVLLFLIFIYVGLALGSESWYQDIDMETPYSSVYYEDKLDSIVQELAIDPLEVTTFNVSEKECEGLLKLAVKADKGVNPYVKGVGFSILQNKLILRTNLEVGTWKKGLEMTIKPYCEEKNRELTVKVERIKIGSFILPAFPVLYLFEKVIPPQGPIKIIDNQIRMSINNMPLALKYVRIESKQLTAGLSMSTVELGKMAASDKELIKEVFKEAEVLQKGLISTQVKEFINELQQKSEILPEDIDKAKAIYNSLSKEDKEVLNRNLRLFLQDTSVRETMQKFGLQ